MKYEITIVTQHNPPPRKDEFAVIAESEWVGNKEDAEKELARVKRLLGDGKNSLAYLEKENKLLKESMIKNVNLNTVYIQKEK